MRITDLLSKQSIEIGVSVKDKASAIESLISLHSESGNLNDIAAYRMELLKERKWVQRQSAWELRFPTLKAVR